jgi:nitrite reductase/ring-hydroxylating ferredoxin subunit
MSLDWSDFPDAPAPGTLICSLGSLPGDGVLSLDLGEFPVLVSRVGAAVTVFVNACPHQFLPLDHRGGVISADGRRLICSNHQAAFDRVTGIGVGGLGTGCALTVVPTEQVGGDLRVAAVG